MSKSLWLPPDQELRKARCKLACNPAAWARTRLRIVDHVLGGSRRASAAEIAKATGVWRSSLYRFLRLWRLGGLEQVARFGRPAELGSVEMEELDRDLAAGKWRSAAELKSWIDGKRGWLVSRQTAYRYAWKRGFQFRRLASTKTAKETQLVRKAHVWTPAQIAALATCDPRNRAVAVLAVGTTLQSIQKIAEERRIPKASLQRWVSRFAAKGAEGLRNLPWRQNIVVRKGCWDAFCQWCDAHRARTGHYPTGAQARDFFNSTSLALDRLMPLRCAYTYLFRWKQLRGIRLASRTRRVKIIPSDGIEIRHFIH